jgi:hypothetical protein
MKRNISIQLKATFLLAVFALNTIVGFACSVGLDMGFNTPHHHDDDEIEISTRIHTEGKKHEHHHDKEDDAKKGDCCNDKVIKFQNLDKNLGQNTKVSVNAPGFVAILSPVTDFTRLNVLKLVLQKQVARNFHPPPHNIRIAIRSFQI